MNASRGFCFEWGKQRLLLASMFLPAAWLFAIGYAPPVNAEIVFDERMKLLLASYRSAIETIEGNTLVMRDGTRITIDDGQIKSHQQKLKSADVEDMLSQIYPTLACRKINAKPERNFDPGRIRNDAFFKAVFGNSADAVRKNLVSVRWFGRTLQVTRILGVSDALKRVREDLDKLKDLDRRFVRRMGGAFNWRRIAGTKRHSVHSFGAAIDVNTKYTNYGGGAVESQGTCRNT